MSSQYADLSTLSAPGNLAGPALCLNAGQTATAVLDGDIDTDCVVYLEKSLTSGIHWDVVETFAEGEYDDGEEAVTIEGPGVFRFRLSAPVLSSDQSSSLDATITDIDTDAADMAPALSTAATAVADTGATNSSPYGFSQAQADAIIAAVNALIVRQGEIEAALIMKAILPAE